MGKFKSIIIDPELEIHTDGNDYTNYKFSEGDILKVNLKEGKVIKVLDEMLYMELPFCRADEFDYESIARIVNRHKPDIIWVSLGAPKQEIFMNMLKPYLHHGVLIAIGAAFKFYCGKGERRAPQWMINNHLEFFYRIIHSPRKQLNRCAWIIRTLPGLLYGEWKRKKEAQRDVATV